MTIDHSVAVRLGGRSLAWRLGASATAAVGIVLITWALSIDVVRASEGGFFGDAATYYSLGRSLAEDFDFEYQRQDLVRVWEEFPGGPEGLFLKRGKESRLFYAKAYIYPLLAAPFIWLFGTNGFFVLHALLMTACFLCAYAFLAARSHPVGALIFAFAFLFISVVPVYLVQLAPDFFIFAVVLIGYFFWCYKEVAGPAPQGSERTVRTQWLFSPRSDAVAAVLLGVGLFAKPTNILLIGPLLVSAALRGQWVRGVKVGALFGAAAALLFAANIAVTGEWNYQGGERRTFYSQTQPGIPGGYPFQSETATFDSVGRGSVGGGSFAVLFTRDALFEVFRRNLAYFFVGRHTGFAVYFFPGMLAILLFLVATRDRAMWQWLTLAAGLGTAVVLLIYMPFTWSGGGGPVGNRYFLGTYGVFLFILPPLQTAVPGLLAMAISGLFMGPLITNPLYASRHPGDHSKAGLYAWLPTELTMVNDLPVNVQPARIRQPLGGDPPVFAYFIDDNVYNREGDAFWVKGESTTDILLRAPIAPESKAAGVREAPSLRIDKLTVILESGPKPNRVTIDTGAGERVIDMAPSSQQTFELEMPDGVPYKYHPDFPTNYVYIVSITSATGFVPMFESGSSDSRHLGVMVRLIPTYAGTP